MLVLASASPRRSELLGEWGYEFALVLAPVSEELPEGVPPERGVQELAKRKALSGLDAWKSRGGSVSDLILGADTIVVLGDKILGKPADEEDAALMLEALSGKIHRVMTGIALVHGNEDQDASIETGVAITTVSFQELSSQEIQNYIATGEPMDKAAAYGIQGEAGKFAQVVNGSYTNVIGLPMELLSERLGERGIFPYELSQT